MLLPLVGFPGGVELLVILFISLLLFSPLVAVVYLVLFRDRIGSADEDRIADLEAEVADLRERLDEASDDDPIREQDGGAGAAGGADDDS